MGTQHRRAFNGKTFEQRRAGLDRASANFLLGDDRVKQLGKILQERADLVAALKVFEKRSIIHRGEFLKIPLRQELLNLGFVHGSQKRDFFELTIAARTLLHG